MVPSPTLPLAPQVLEEAVEALFFFFFFNGKKFQ